MRKPNNKTAKHDAGEALFVREGHLHVATPDGPHQAAVAIYAPGTWVHAQVGDALAEEA